MSLVSVREEVAELQIVVQVICWIVVDHLPGQSYGKLQVRLKRLASLKAWEFMKGGQDLDIMRYN